MLKTFRRPDPTHDPTGRKLETCVSRSAGHSIEQGACSEEQQEIGSRRTPNPFHALDIAAAKEHTEGLKEGNDVLEPQAVPATNGKMSENIKLSESRSWRAEDSDTMINGAALCSKMSTSSQPTPMHGRAPIAAASDEDHEGTVENHKRRRSQVDSTSQTQHKEKVLKLTPARINELVTPIGSVPVRAVSPFDANDELTKLPSPVFNLGPLEEGSTAKFDPRREGANVDDTSVLNTSQTEAENAGDAASFLHVPRPLHSARALSSPAVRGLQSPSPQRRNTDKSRSKPTPAPLWFSDRKRSGGISPAMDDLMPSPMPSSIPLPPLSLPTFLQLELSSFRPSPLYIHRSVTSDFPYESSRVKIERLLNFLLLPPQLEQVLNFGVLACFDAWLYTFTILPLRLLKSFYILGQSWAANLATEVRFISSFVYAGTGRMWERRRTRGNSAPRPSLDRGITTFSEPGEQADQSTVNTSSRGLKENRQPLSPEKSSQTKSRSTRRHRRIKSVPSALQPDDKADILKGLLIITTCLMLMRLDASRMYHWVRGQAAIKLYVFYNVLEVGDRLLSALGQDVLECLFSREALERGPDGHSKVLRPFWLFLLALAYTISHATALFYQVITLNVAVNSYSNALITLLMSNQFVEIKSTVFKKFEKENLFQLTCADVVERFQLWLMLTIIASRNIVETGGLSAGITAFGTSSSSFSPLATNSSSAFNQPPRSATSILPKSFTLFPAILSSLTAFAPSIGHVLGPFVVVLGSEMIVDWLKHSYINKFNNTRPAIYGRFLDVLAKDYYSNAFADQNLTKRLGLPVIPLSCLFIRASVQTYHMFVAAWVPPSLPPSATGLTSVHGHYSTAPTSVPTSTAAAISQKFDALLRQLPASISSSEAFSNLTTILIFLLVFLVLLVLKLVLGMLLLAFARSRYRSMKEREKNPIHHVEGGRRVGGWGVVEVDDDKRRWIYEDDAEGARKLREREAREKAKREKGTGEGAFEMVKRYEMVAKRIW
jgi:Eukaryotic membrane protein family